MKSRLFIFCETAVLLGLATWMAGCATHGFDKATRTSADVADTRRELVRMRQQVTNTLDVLDHVVEQSKTNSRTMYVQYVKSVDRLVVRADQMRASARRAQESGNDYFQDWGRELGQFHKTQVRHHSEERRSSLMEGYRNIGAAIQSVEESFEAFLADLRDIQRYLDIDLTPASVTSIQDVITEAKSDGQEVERRIEAAIQELDRLAGLPPEPVPSATNETTRARATNETSESKQ